MRSISRLFTAFGNLADSITALAHLVDTVSGRLRQCIAFEGDTAVLDNHTSHSTEGETEAAASAAKRGRRAS